MTSFQEMMTADDAIASRVAGYLKTLQSLGVEPYMALQLALSFQTVLCAEGANERNFQIRNSREEQQDAIDTGSPK